MSDPISERAHYLTMGGGGTEDLFLIQQGRLDYLGFVRPFRRRPATEPRKPEPSAPEASIPARPAA